MDDSRFDVWTRRRFGLAAGGLAAILLGDEAVAKKKRKKRCRKKGANCGGKRKCCRRLRCAETGEVGIPVRRCCTDDPTATCRSDADCCLPLACSPMTSLCSEA
jgi:hypothetical protein